MGQPVSVEVGHGTPPVVVVNDSPPAGGAPAYVTVGELDARLELLETRLSERIAGVGADADDARALAHDAADDAAVAVVVAAVAAEAAEEAVDGLDEPDAAESDAESGEVLESGGEPAAPRAPERRSDVKKPAGGQPADGGKRKPSGYGAGFLSGR